MNPPQIAVRANIDADGLDSLDGTVGSMIDHRVNDDLLEALEAARANTDGEPSDYLTQVAGRDVDSLAASVCTTEGEVVGVGDDEVPLALQSVSKAFTYAVALQERGLDVLMEHVGIEPSGEAFNELSQHSDGRPRNPLINAGAIMTNALIPGDTIAEREELLLDRFSAMASEQLEVSEDVYAAEQTRAHRNLALGHMLAAAGLLAQDPDDVVQGYLRQCSIEVNTRQMAIMGAVFASGGRNPVTGERIFDERVVQQTLSVMLTCGMYNASGRWVANIGIAAKSGVSGALLGAVPGALGLATYSPRLDRYGNSTRGVDVFTDLSVRWDLHLLRHKRPLQDQTAVPE